MFSLLMGWPYYVRAEGLSDQDISDAVEDKISADRVVPVNNLQIHSALGVVTLTGTVNNVLAKERAAKVAETVRGVKSVVNRIQVKPVRRPDTYLKRDIQHALTRNPALAKRDVKVTAKDGVITLSGEVSSYPERQIAINIAMSIKGVRDVLDELVVIFSEKRSDEEIRKDIVEGLKWDSVVERNKISVAVKDGIVTLTGTVGSAAEKARVFTLASVNGVRSIDTSKLEVAAFLEPGQHVNQTVTDEEIRNALHNALLVDPRVNAYKVDINVKNWVVTLRGIVERLEAKKAAEQDARNTRGVFIVKNRLKVNPDQEIDDAEIAGEIRDSLRLDPFLEKYQIGANVAGGIAYLTGTVDTFFERDEAELVASRIRGVIDVSNGVLVREVSPYSYESNAVEPRPGKWAEDNVLQQDVKNYLSWDPLFLPDQIQVAIKQGVVTLTGTVDSVYAKNMAAKDAFNAGAHVIINNIAVR